MFQLEGKIRLMAESEDLVTLTVSKHGVKVLDRQKRVSIFICIIRTEKLLEYFGAEFKFSISARVFSLTVGNTAASSTIFSSTSRLLHR